MLLHNHVKTDTNWQDAFNEDNTPSIIKATSDWSNLGVVLHNQIRLCVTVWLRYKDIHQIKCVCRSVAAISCNVCMGGRNAEEGEGEQGRM